MTAEDLRQRALVEADPRVCARGWEVFRSGVILRATHSGQHYRLRVQGSERLPSRVNLNLARGKWSCTCPYEHSAVRQHVLAALHGLVETPDSVQDEPASKTRRVRLDGLSEDAVLNLLAQLEDLYPELMQEYALTAAHEIEREDG